MRRLFTSLFEQTWFKSIAFGLVYFAAALFSSLLSFQGAHFPTFWFPSGLLVAVLLINPVSQWPAYLVASLPAGLLYSLFADQPVANIVLLTVLTMLEAATAGWLIRRYEARPGKFQTPQNVFNLIIFSALVSTALSAAIATTILATVLPGVSYWATWRLNWVSHMLGVLVAAPLVLTWVDLPAGFVRKSNPDRLIELAILMTGLTVCALYISIGTFSNNQQNYLVVPFLVWAALRFGPRGTATAGLIFTSVSIWGTLYKVDGFAINDPTIDPTMQGLGSFLTITLVMCYIITSLWEQSRSIQQALQENESRYRLLVENQGEGMAIINENEIFTFSNPAANQIFGLSNARLEGRSLSEFANPQQFAAACQQNRQTGKDMKIIYELEINQPGGRRCCLQVNATPQYNQEGQYTGIFTVFHDITEQKLVERTLRDSRVRYQTLFDNSPIPIWEKDFSRIRRMVEQYHRNGVEDLREYLNNNPDQIEVCRRSIRVLDVNKAALQQLGFTDKSEFLAQAPKLIQHAPHDVFLEEILAIDEGKTEFLMEGPNDLIDDVVQYHSVRWTVAPGHEQDYKRVIVSIIDVTERKQSEEKLRYLSTHDVLTGLYNRNFFEAELGRLQNSRLEPVNLMMVDVNSMKSTNDTYGHAAGDELLRRTAQVLRLSFRKEDIIARIGGDEFVILFHGNVTLEEAVNRVEECLAEHNHWYSGPALSLAIGTASGGKDSSLIALFKKADQQMYKEKTRMRKVKADGKMSSGDSSHESQAV